MKKLTCAMLCIVMLFSLAIPSFADGLIVNVPEYIDTYQEETVDLYCYASDPLGGELSYIWYSSSTDDMATMTAVNRGTETSDTLRVETSFVGVTYYWCLVESTSGDSAYSSVCRITVYEKLNTPDETEATEATETTSETTAETTEATTTEPATEATTTIPTVIQPTESTTAAPTTEVTTVPAVIAPPPTEAATSASTEALTEEAQTSVPATSEALTLPAASSEDNTEPDDKNDKNEIPQTDHTDGPYIPTIGATPSHKPVRFELIILLVVAIICFVIAAVCAALLIYIFVRKAKKKKRK